MYSSKELDESLKKVSFSRETAYLAKQQYLKEVKEISNLVKAEANKDINQFLNKKYLLVSPKHFGIHNCLQVRDTGDNLKYIRFIESKNSNFVIADFYNVVLVQKGFYFLEFFGGDEKVVEYFSTHKEFKEYFDIQADYLFLGSYVGNEAGVDLNENLDEFVLLKL